MKLDFTESIIKTINENKIYRIVFLGDSHTSSDWLHPNFREIIEYVLKQELTKKTGKWKKPYWNINCINSGLDGATSSDILERLDTCALSYQPSLVLLMIGINDLGKGLGIDKHISNTTKILSAFRQRNIPSIFATSPATKREKVNREFEMYVTRANHEIKPLPDLYIDLFSEFQKLPFSSFYTLMSEGNEQAGVHAGDIDFFHPNQLGNAYIAKIMLAKIFGINFNPEIYMQQTKEGVMEPKY